MRIKTARPFMHENEDRISYQGTVILPWRQKMASTLLQMFCCSREQVSENLDCKEMVKWREGGGS